MESRRRFLLALNTLYMQKKKKSRNKSKFKSNLKGLKS
jgi:hypothetical protein